VSKIMLGVVLGGVLGIFDGLSALVSTSHDPRIREGIVGIVIGSTFKGLLAGALIGWYAKRSASLAATLGFGLVVGLSLAFFISLMQMLAGENPYYWQIMLPGGILGLIVGYATFKSPASRPAPAAPSR
jgi:peptidoglycan/LPS O-acetylase OafA/YrhL